MKTCNKCKIEKNFNEFNLDKKQKDGYKYKCKLCCKQYYDVYNKNNAQNLKKYFEKNKERLHEINKQYYVNNKQKHKDRCITWKSKNKEKVQQYGKNFKEKNKLWFQIKNAVFCRIWSSLKNKSKKHLKTEQYLGCDIESYKQYLEQHFLPEMNWGNYGILWEIDHIKGCCKFDLTKIEEQKRCFHFLNTKPMFKTTNLAKSLGYENEIGNRNKNKY